MTIQKVYQVDLHHVDEVFQWGGGEPERAGARRLAFYWLLFFALPSGAKDDLNGYVFPLAIPHVKWEPLHLSTWDPYLPG